MFELFDKYNLRSLSVVNAESHPIGVITVDVAAADEVMAVARPSLAGR